MKDIQTDAGLASDLTQELEANTAFRILGELLMVIDKQTAARTQAMNAKK